MGEATDSNRRPTRRRTRGRLLCEVRLRASSVMVKVAPSCSEARDTGNCEKFSELKRSVAWIIVIERSGGRSLKI